MVFFGNMLVECPFGERCYRKDCFVAKSLGDPLPCVEAAGEIADKYETRILRPVIDTPVLGNIYFSFARWKLRQDTHRAAEEFGIGFDNFSSEVIKHLNLKISGLNKGE